MKTAAAALLLSGLVTASPFRTPRHQGNVLIPHNKKGLRPEAAPGANITSDFSSDNWSGVGFTSAPSSGSYTSVSGTFTVPDPQAPTSGSGSWYGCAWVGIDGDTVQNALFQGGIDWTVTVDDSGDSSTSYSTWIEWIPDAQVNVDGISMNAGDSISVTCTATSSTEGYCTYTNNSNGQSVTAQSSAPSSSASLSGQNVEWIVEDFELGGGLAPFANYGSDSFTDCTAVAGGETYGLSGAQLITLVDSNGDTLSSCSISGDESFSCSYQ